MISGVPRAIKIAGTFFDDYWRGPKIWENIWRGPKYHQFFWRGPQNFGEVRGQLTPPSGAPLSVSKLSFCQVFRCVALMMILSNL